MINIMALLMISQLDHFGFVTVSSPQTAGDSFFITVYAYDASNNIFPYNGPATIFATPGPQYGDTSITFNGGVWQGNFRATLANTYSIRCQDYSSPPHTGESNQIIFNPNTPYRLLTILPGQTYYPGIDTGKTGNVTPQQAGAYFNVTAYLTDRWCNSINSAADSVRCTSTDQFRIPQTFILNNGSLTFSYAFRTTGNQRIYLIDITNPSIKSDTSSSIYIYPGPYAKLLVILPGETYLPGDTTTIFSNTPGKSGTPSPQYVLENFTTTVYATDTMWNKTNSTNSVQLYSDFSFSSDSPQNLNNGEAQFTVNFSNRGDNQNLWAQDLTNGNMSYQNYLDIEARAANITVTVNPDTIQPGEIAQITAIIYDRTGAIIEGKLVIFSVLGGHGEIPVSYQTTYTNSFGVCYSQFICKAGYFNELDTIGVTADNFTDSGAVCYVMIPDSSVMEGNLIAYPNPFGNINKNKTQFIYYLAQDCNVIYAIYDPFGNLVHRQDIAPGANGARQGINILEWNGRNDKRKKVASGVYYVVIKGYLHTNVFLEKRIRVGVIW